MRNTLMLGDCVEAMGYIESGSIDAIVTDPPYGLGFMGKAWDALPPGLPWAQECLRVLKPGGHLLAFGGTRTWHRLAVAIEDAGFEMRDSIAWLYGSGFPKNMDVSKAIDKAADESTDAAREWEGWGTALKPAFEPIVVARKPLGEKTVAANVLAHGTGALNIDASRISAGGEKLQGGRATGSVKAAQDGWNRPFMDDPDAAAAMAERAKVTQDKAESMGRHPANVILDESQAAALDAQSGYQKDGVSVNRNRDSAEVANTIYSARGKDTKDAGYGGGGGASRFFYCAKAPKSERPIVDEVAHPTVKPLALMRYLVKLVTPPGGLVLDPFVGSGATVEAAIQEGFDYIGIDQEVQYLRLAQARIERNNTEQEEAA